MDSSVHAPTLGVVREISIGGLRKPELLAELDRQKIRLNEAALALFAHEKFTTNAVSSRVKTVEFSVARLGFRQGATISEIRGSISNYGLAVCPVEAGPHFRLQFSDQPEGSLGHTPTQHRAPHGSITIVSPELADDVEFPKGFYVRRIDGTLWLRGYRAGNEHIWSPEDRLLCLAQNDV